MTATPPLRRGVTLIELLVAITVIALLIALTAGAVSAVRRSQTMQATEATLNKLQSSLDQRAKAVRDAADEDARKDQIPPQIMVFAGNDKDRARTIWMYMKLKNELPTTRAEAVTPVVVGGFSLPPRAMFATLPTGGTEEEQSAALLYLALSRSGNRGDVTGLEGTQNQEKDITLGSGTARVFADGWGQPIMYVRMAFPTEVNGPPYLRSATQAAKDPIDPLGKLTQPSGTWDATRLTSFWAAMRANHIGANTTTVPSIGGANGLVPLPYPNPSRNWVPTLVSAGPNKSWDGDPFGGDNVVGFRLRKEGQRGD